MNAIAKIFSYLYSQHVTGVERNIGYSLKFKNIPQEWIGSWMTFDMERSWLKHGIKAKGVNYFTMGSIDKGLSSRFVRSRKQYQSWLGAYLVKFKDKEDLTLQDHYNLAVADQKNWLEDFGDPSPWCEMLVEKTGKVKEIKIGKYKAKLYEFLGGYSHSDVGDKSNNPRNRILMFLMASMFNKNNSKLNLKGRNFIPEKPFRNYEKILLKGYIAIIDLDKKRKVVLYGNGVTIKDKKGKVIDYTSRLKEDILKAFYNVKIDKI